MQKSRQVNFSKKFNQMFMNIPLDSWIHEKIAPHNSQINSLCDICNCFIASPNRWTYILHSNINSGMFWSAHKKCWYKFESDRGLVYPNYKELITNDRN